MIIEHQFVNKHFFMPNWKIKYLFIGTFNPEGGQKVNYFYGRESNYTWKILSEIFEDDFNPTKDDFFDKLCKHKIACVDIIEKVKFDENKYNKDRVIGKGYKDSNIINTKVTRTYTTEKILNLIEENPEVKVFTTWGKGSNLRNWKDEIGKISNKINLVSPSRAAKVPKGMKKEDYIFDDWNSKIKITR